MVTAVYMCWLGVYCACKHTRMLSNFVHFLSNECSRLQLERRWQRWTKMAVCPSTSWFPLRTSALFCCPLSHEILHQGCVFDISIRTTLLPMRILSSMPLSPFKFLHTLFLSPTNSHTHTQEFVAFITPRLLDKNQKQDVDEQVLWMVYVNGCVYVAMCMSISVSVAGSLSLTQWQQWTSHRSEAR